MPVPYLHFPLIVMLSGYRNRKFIFSKMFDREASETQILRASCNLTGGDQTEVCAQDDIFFATVKKLVNVVTRFGGKAKSSLLKNNRSATC